MHDFWDENADSSRTDVTVRRSSRAMLVTHNYGKKRF
jgi:hypothetical protein